jgi:hypothetical protein
MCITAGGANRNRRIGIPNPTKGRQPLGESPLPQRLRCRLADPKFLQCWLFGLPIGKQAIAYLLNC